MLNKGEKTMIKIAEHKKPFLKLLAQKLYRERKATTNGASIEDLRTIGVPEDEWQWIQQEIVKLDQK
jgi:hypothetical protein